MNFLLVSLVADIVKEILDPCLIVSIVLLDFTKCSTCNSGLGFEDRFLDVFVTDLLKHCLFSTTLKPFNYTLIPTSSIVFVMQGNETHADKEG